MERVAYYDRCRHQLRGSHLLRELTFIVESNGFRWTRLMKALLSPKTRGIFPICAEFGPANQCG